MSGLKKPSVVARENKVKLYRALGKPIPAETRVGYTDTYDILSPQVRIAYKDRGTGILYPSEGARAAALRASKLAMKIMRGANEELAAVVMLRRRETPLFTTIMANHFRLIAGDRNRRSMLEKIRQNMLHVSFHLNTGIYLIDSDNARRDMETGEVVAVGSIDPREEGSVSPAKTAFDKATWRPVDSGWVSDKLTSGFQHGQIHIYFEKLRTYSDISYARVIIHEATHKFLNTDDEAYARFATYGALSQAQKLNNADSYAWAAVSFYCGAVRMGSHTDYDRDWKQCARAAP